MSDREPVQPRGTAAYVAEFMGTFFLVLFIVLAYSVNSKNGLGYTDYAVVGLVHAFVLMMLVHTLGRTSGAHFNPAVTAALAALRKISPSDAAIYVVLQLAGAIAGALVGKALLLDEGGAPVNYGAPAVGDLLSGGLIPGMVAELLGTFVLMWAIMGLAVDPRGDKGWAGLVIGATLGFAVMAIGPLTGGGFNPARALGPALVAREFGDAVEFVVVYVVGPVVGALLAAFAYSVVVLRDQEGDRPGERPIDHLT